MESSEFRALMHKEVWYVTVRIRNNIASIDAQRQLSDATGALSRTLERLSSGSRINNASDDAAGLSVVGHRKTDLTHRVNEPR